MNLLQLNLFAIALLKGNSESAKILVDNGADVNFCQAPNTIGESRNINGKTTLMSMVLALTQEQNDSATLAALGDRIEHLIASNPNININLCDAQGSTVLHYIAKCKTMTEPLAKVLEILITYGADPNILDKNDASPIWYAVKGKHIKAIDTLATKSKLLSKVDDDGNNLLHLLVSTIHSVLKCRTPLTSFFKNFKNAHFRGCSI